MTRYTLLLFLLPLAFTGCEDDDDLRPTAPELPTSYTFERNGTSTVSFSGQSARIAMAEELVAALLEPSTSEETLMNMFRNAGPNGEDVAPFTTAELNAETKSLRSKVAASAERFSANATEAAAIRSDFDGWIAAQASEVFPAWDQLAAPGQPGQVADGSRVRYVNGGGLEYNQAFAKSLIGALMLDQALNNYLSPTVLDEAQNRAENDAATPADGQVYTTMEHKWDEAYGYVFGASPDAANPLTTLGQDDNFLNEYLGKVDEDPDFVGIGQQVFDQFLAGRAAIVTGDYVARAAAAAELRELLSRVIAVRAIYYLEAGAAALETNRLGSAFHALSEAYGFIYSLQFTHNPTLSASYYDRAEVQELLDALYHNNESGFHSLDPASARQLGERIAERFTLDYAAAATN